MVSFIIENTGTIIVCLVIAVLVCAAVVKIIRDRKKGRSSCSCGCTECSLSESCKKNKTEASNQQKSKPTEDGDGV